MGIVGGLRGGGESGGAAIVIRGAGDRAVRVVAQALRGVDPGG